VFLSHYTGGGIESVLNLFVEDFFLYLDSALELYKIEIERPQRVILAGIEKSKGNGR